MVHSNVSGRILLPEVRVNKSLYDIKESKVVTSLDCEALSPVYCSVKWIAIAIVAEAAFGLGKPLFCSLCDDVRFRSAPKQ